MALRLELGGFVLEHLAIGEQAGAEGGVGDVLHGEVAIDRQHGGRRGRLAENHEDGLHADRAIGDMRGAAGHGGEEVGDLAALRDERAVRDRVG